VVLTAHVFALTSADCVFSFSQVLAHGTPSQVGRALLRAWHWWCQEVGSLVPFKLRTTWQSAPRRIEINAVDGDAFVFAATGVQADREALIRLSQTFGWVTAVRIRVPIEKCFVREKRIPKQALARADDVLLLDMEQATVFQRSNVLTGWYQAPSPDPSRIILRQIILKRSLISGFLDDLEIAGLPLSAVEVFDKDAPGEMLNLLPVSARRGDKLTTTLRSFGSMFAAFTVVVTICIYAITTVRLQGAVEKARRDIVRAAKQAQAVTTALERADLAGNQLRQLRLRKLQEPLVVATWEELTLLLPPTSWIPDLSLANNAGQIDGYSANAADLIAILTRSGIFENVTFASPVTRDTQRTAERFQIKFHFRRQAADSALQMKVP
jgi:general secretion pathway protein L